MYLNIKAAKNVSMLIRALERFVMDMEGSQVRVKINDLTGFEKKKQWITGIWKFFIEENVFAEWDKFLSFSDDYSELIITHIPGYSKIIQSYVKHSTK